MQWQTFNSSNRYNEMCVFQQTVKGGARHDGRLAAGQIVLKNGGIVKDLSGLLP
jgi:hypothetical protein